MRVVCISDKWEAAPEAAHEPKPEIGDFDTVVKELKHDLYGLFYELERFPDVYYGADMFATLPDATAEDMQEEETATIHEPVNC
jgi:hypothetical protein